MSQQVKNPFEHHHEHHDHEHEEELVQELDPAQQSLADALRVSFLILKIVMVALLVLYLGSGIFSVDAQHNAVRLRFGQIVGQPGDQVYGEGWHFGLPYPIEQVKKVPVNPRGVDIVSAFTPEATAGNQGGGRRPLNPQRDGSLLTGDANIVHGQFSISYTIDDPAKYVRSVGDLELADQLVRSAAEQGIIYAVAQTEADGFIAGRTNMRPARVRAGEVLREQNTGISIDTFVLNESYAPRSVSDAFDAVTRAESEKAQMIDEARTQQQTTLGSAAGEAALPRDTGENGPLLSLILAYERAQRLGNPDQAEQLDAALDRAFRQLQAPVDPDAPGGRTVPIGAEAAQVIQNARSYRAGVVQQVRAEADTVTSLSKEYASHPRLLRSRLWQDAREQILTGEVETIYSMPGKPYLVTNRDPAVKRKQQRQRLQAEQQQVDQPQQR